MICPAQQTLLQRPAGMEPQADHPDALAFEKFQQPGAERDALPDLPAAGKCPGGTTPPCGCRPTPPWDRCAPLPGRGLPAPGRCTRRPQGYPRAGQSSSEAPAKSPSPAPGTPPGAPGPQYGPAVECQYPVIHGLGAQLDGGDAILPQEGKHLRLHGVGTGGEPDAPHPPRPDIGRAASSSRSIYPRSMAVKLPPKKAISASAARLPRLRRAVSQAAVTSPGSGGHSAPEMAFWSQKLHR